MKNSNTDPSAEAAAKRKLEEVHERFLAELAKHPEISDEEFMAEFEVSDEEYSSGLIIPKAW